MLKYHNSHIFPVLERWPVILAEICLKFEIHHVSAIVIIHVNTDKCTLSTSVCVFICLRNVLFRPVGVGERTARANSVHVSYIIVTHL